MKYNDSGLIAKYILNKLRKEGYSPYLDSMDENSVKELYKYVKANMPEYTSMMDLSNIYTTDLTTNNKVYNLKSDTNYVLYYDKPFEYRLGNSDGFTDYIKVKASTNVDSLGKVPVMKVTKTVGTPYTLPSSIANSNLSIKVIYTNKTNLINVTDLTTISYDSINTAWKINDTVSISGESVRMMVPLSGISYFDRSYLEVEPAIYFNCYLDGTTPKIDIIDLYDFLYCNIDYANLENNIEYKTFSLATYKFVDNWYYSFDISGVIISASGNEYTYTTGTNNLRYIAYLDSWYLINTTDIDSQSETFLGDTFFYHTTISLTADILFSMKMPSGDKLISFDVAKESVVNASAISNSKTMVFSNKIFDTNYYYNQKDFKNDWSVYGGAESTQTNLEAKLLSANLGKVYKYTGSSITDSYTQNSFYQVIESSTDLYTFSLVNALYCFVDGTDEIEQITDVYKSGNIKHIKTSQTVEINDVDTIINHYYVYNNNILISDYETHGNNEDPEKQILFLASDGSTTSKVVKYNGKLAEVIASGGITTITYHDGLDSSTYGVFKDSSNNIINYFETANYLGATSTTTGTSGGLIFINLVTDTEGTIFSHTYSLSTIQNKTPAINSSENGSIIIDGKYYVLPAYATLQGSIDYESISNDLNYLIYTNSYYNDYYIRFQDNLYKGKTGTIIETDDWTAVPGPASFAFIPDEFTNTKLLLIKYNEMLRKYYYELIGNTEGSTTTESDISYYFKLQTWIPTQSIRTTVTDFNNITTFNYSKLVYTSSGVSYDNTTILNFDTNPDGKVYLIVTPRVGTTEDPDSLAFYGIMFSKDIAFLYNSGFKNGAEIIKPMYLTTAIIKPGSILSDILSISTVDKSILEIKDSGTIKLRELGDYYDFIEDKSCTSQNLDLILIDRLLNKYSSYEDIETVRSYLNKAEGFSVELGDTWGTDLSNAIKEIKLDSDLGKNIKPKFNEEYELTKVTSSDTNMIKYYYEVANTEPNDLITKETEIVIEEEI